MSARGTLSTLVRCQSTTPRACMRMVHTYTNLYSLFSTYTCTCRKSDLTSIACTHTHTHTRRQKRCGSTARRSTAGGPMFGQTGCQGRHASSIPACLPLALRRSTVAPVRVGPVGGEGRGWRWREEALPADFPRITLPSMTAVFVRSASIPRRPFVVFWCFCVQLARVP